jgi:hypothetical protein
MLPPPVPKKSSGTLIAIVIVVIIAVVVTAGVGAYLLGRSLVNNPPLNPPTKTYSGNISVASWNSATTYQSQSPSHAYFLIVNATFKNTGDNFTASRLDWAIRNIDGFLIDFPVSTFYTEIAFVKGETTTHTIVFDLTTYADPAKISLDLPNGKTLNTAL